MGVIAYDASTAGGQLMAKTVASLIHTIDDLKHLQDLMVEVGNATDPFSATNFQAANNDRFAIAPADCQTAYDQVATLNTAFQTLLATDGNEARLASLYQAD